MLATGTIDPIARTFDILGVNETATTITIINGTLRLAYTSPEGIYVQLAKPISNDDSISIGDDVGSSQVQDNGIGGYAQKTTQNKFGTALTSVDWNDTSKLTTKTFPDSNGITRTAVLLPVIIQ